jgi:hypothetical protein
MQSRLAFQHLAHPHAIELLVALRPRTPHRRAARAVQQPELNAHRIGHLAHHAAQRVHFAHQVPLGHAANRRIAAHLRNQVEVHGDQRRLHSHARRRHRRLAPGVPSAHHHYVILFDKNHLKLFYGFLDGAAEWNGLPGMKHTTTRLLKMTAESDQFIGMRKTVVVQFPNRRPTSRYAANERVIPWPIELQTSRFLSNRHRISGDKEIFVQLR